MYLANTLEVEENSSTSSYNSNLRKNGIMSSYIAHKAPLMYNAPANLAARPDTVLTRSTLEKMLKEDAGFKLQEQARIDHDYLKESKPYVQIPLIKAPTDYEWRQKFAPKYSL